MPSLSRKDDIGSGHGCHYPPSSAIAGSGDVLVEGKPALRVGDAFAAHACPIHGGTHARALAKGSPSVFINGRAAGRVGDAIDCGGAVTTGSGSVILDEA